VNVLKENIKTPFMPFKSIQYKAEIGKTHNSVRFSRSYVLFYLLTQFLNLHF
jgi:hypothetical protein